MKQLPIWMPVILLVLFFLLLSFSKKAGVIPFVIPKNWPQPAYDFSKKPVTENGFLLGNRLFYDPILSKDSTVSCASCHLSYTAFTHIDHRVSHGIYGRQGTRNSISLVNLAWKKSLMWDGAIQNLELQPLLPISHPSEMDNTMDDVVQKLGSSGKYRSAFFQTFGDSMITADRVLRALTQFTVMLVSYNAKYDSIMRKEPNAVFLPAEENGYRLFKIHCAACHTEPLFTNEAYENNGLPVDTALMDWGRLKITGDPADSLRFKVPALRNIQFSAPYFHDGRFNKLSEVIDHYTSGIIYSTTLAKDLRQNISLSKTEKKDLIAFLKTLTDQSFIYNRAFQFDFPDLYNQR
jgi:cytochrome c peroxidase